MINQRIAIYQGEGASPLTLSEETIVLTEENFLTSDWEKTISILIFPGGRDRPYHAALQGAGNQKIRSFVEKGGTYLGLCAGAYYGCRHVEFDRGFPLEVCEERELSFFNGKAIGPAYGKGTYEYGTQRGARAARLQIEGGDFCVFHNGGCTFEGDFSACKIWARHLDLPDCPPAIIECPIGAGRAILSGVHIETSAHSLDPTDPFIETIWPSLSASEASRLQFWAELLSHFT
jgi:biotin--protein ligase